MVFEVQARGRRMSDGGNYELSVQVDARDAAEAASRIEDYDWEDAATRDVKVTPVPAFS